MIDGAGEIMCNLYPRMHVPEHVARGPAQYCPGDIGEAGGYTGRYTIA